MTRARTHWTTSQDMHLRFLLGMGASHRLCARRIGRTVAAISHRASVLGLLKPRPVNLKRMMQRIHTQGETQ
jgi:hypothetical protein